MFVLDSSSGIISSGSGTSASPGEAVVVSVFASLDFVSLSLVSWLSASSVSSTSGSGSGIGSATFFAATFFTGSSTDFGSYIFLDHEIYILAV